MVAELLSLTLRKLRRRHDTELPRANEPRGFVNAVRTSHQQA